MNHSPITLAALALLGSTLLGCNTKASQKPATDTSTSVQGSEQTASKKGSIEQVNGTQARQLVSQGSVLLDVRTPEEFAEGHIEGATNIPVGELENRLAEVPAEADVVVYCRSGNRSAKAAAILKDAGHPVHDLGPMSAW